VSTDRLAAAHRLLDEAVDELSAAAGAGAADDELLSQGLGKVDLPVM
jgi:hypothetical protein